MLLGQLFRRHHGPLSQPARVLCCCWAGCGLGSKSKPQGMCAQGVVGHAGVRWHQGIMGQPACSVLLGD